MPRNHPLVWVGSCTLSLRIIPLPLKPATMPHLTVPERGPYRRFTPFLLPTRSVGPRVACACCMLPRLTQGLRYHRPATPLKPKRKRSNAPKPLNGLTHKPHCALCARETAHPQAPPPVPPDPMAPTNRRPRQVDTSRHFCPHNGCDYRGWLGRGNLRANGHPSGGPWRQFHCTACDGFFPRTPRHDFHGKQAEVDLIVRVLACPAEGLGIRATARVFEVAPNTVLPWLTEAAEQLRAFSAYFLCDLHLEQLQLDELYAVLRDLKAGKISDDEASTPSGALTVLGVDGDGPHEQAPGGRRCRRPHPGHGAAGRASGHPDVSAGLCAAVSDRWLQGLCHRVADPLWLLNARRTAPGHRTDAQTEMDAAARTALCASRQVLPATAPWGLRTGWCSAPGWLSNRSWRRVGGPSTRPLWSGSTWTSVSAWRPSDAGSTRSARGKRACGISWCCSRCITTLSCPTPAFARALDEPIRTPRMGSAKLWRPCTPAMAAGLTDHVWSLREVLLFRVPPWPQPQTV